MSDSKQNDAEAFSAIEEEFFRVGDALDAEAARGVASAVEAEPVRAGVWARLFKRTSRIVAAQPVEPAVSAADDEWDWQIAVARARHSTSS